VTSIGKWAFAYCNSLTIYCEAESQPEGWSEDWNYSNCPVEWGYGAGTEGVVYTISSDGEYATVTGYTGTARKVEVAARYQGIPVTEIGYEAFHGCSSLTEIVLPDSITTISQRAFYACSGLKNFIIPNSVTTIVREAFSACSGLTEIGIPANVTYIEDAAFIYCHNLTKITVVSNNATYRDIDGNLYTKDGKRLMQYAMGKTETSFTVPNGVEIIASEAFNDSYNLTEVVLPDSVITISHSAFYNCYNLIDIVLPNSVKSIGPYAFKKCTSLTEIVIPISVTSISWCAFEGCNNLTIYCEATSKPSGWASNWNYSGRPVEWGYKE